MSEQQLDRALQALRTAAVHPPMFSEDELDAAVRATPRRRWMLWFFAALAVGAAIVGTSFMPMNEVESDQFVGGTSGKVDVKAPPSTNAMPSTVENKSDPAVQEVDVRSIDPNSIMFLKLDSEELHALGIRVSEDSVVAEQLLMLGEVPGLSHEAKEHGCDTTFSGILLSYTHSYNRTPTGQHRLDSCVDTYPQKIFIEDVTTYSSSSFREDALALPSALTPPDLWRFIHGTARDTSIIPVAEKMKAIGYYLPKWHVFRRDAKPIVLVVPATTRRGNYHFWLMPTAIVHARLPRRYQATFGLLYDEYKPQHRMPINMLAQVEKMFSAKLVQDVGQAGLTTIEIDNDQLWRLGVIRDSAELLTVNGYHRDTDRPNSQGSFLQGTVAAGLQRVQGFRWPCDPDELPKMSGGLIDTTVRLHMTDTARFEMPQSMSFRVIDPNGTTLNSFGIATLGKGWLDSVWEHSHSRVADLLVRVAGKLSLCRSDIDSILRYIVVEGSVRVPVCKLLVPVRVSTPWISDSTVQPQRLKRLEAILWYAPTKRFFGSLPTQVRAFIEPEYQAVVNMIEEQLGQQETCERLLVPSALGLCSQRDTVVRLDGIGPIPAREYITINLYSRIDAPVMVKLIDQSGTSIYELPGQHIAPGANQLTIPLPAQTLPQGAYTVLIDCAGHLVTSRVLIER